MNTRNLSELFEQARKTTSEVPVSDIRSLVESGKTSPLAAKASFGPRRIVRLFNPLKFLVMIAPIILITSALLIWNPAGRQETARQTNAENSQIHINKLITEKPGASSEAALPKQPATEVHSDPAPDDAGALSKSSVYQINTNNSSSFHPAAEKDTVLNGVILDLSKEELIRLGFLFDEEGYYFLNKLPDGSKLNFWSWHNSQGGSIGFGAGSYVNQANKSKLHEFDYYPIFTTNAEGGDLRNLWQYDSKKFELMKDTLVPVLFSWRKLGGYPTSDRLVWFKVSDHFFDLLGKERIGKSRQIYHQAKELSQPGISRVRYDFSLVGQASIALRLKPEVLKCMGIDYSHSRIQADIRAMEYWFHIDLYKPLNGPTTYSGTTKLVKPINSPADTLMPTTESIILLGVSNFGGIETVDMFTRAYRQLKLKDMKFRDYLDLCITVGVDMPREDSAKKEVIFWIYPNEMFFNCLPVDIAGPLMKEFNYQKRRLDPDFVPQMGGSIGLKRDGQFKDSVSLGHPVGISGQGLKGDSEELNTEPVPCVYFTNLCEAIPGLDYVNLYPNPASDHLKVDLVLQNAKKIRFRVVDLGGRILIDEVSPVEYPVGGQYTHQVDVSKITGGLYLLVMTDEEGAKVTRRFVKN